MTDERENIIPVEKEENPTFSLKIRVVGCESSKSDVFLLFLIAVAFFTDIQVFRLVSRYLSLFSGFFCIISVSLDPRREFTTLGQHLSAFEHFLCSTRSGLSSISFFDFFIYRSLYTSLFTVNHITNHRYYAF